MSDQQHHEPLRALQALGDELARATQADETATKSRRRFHLPGLPVLALAAAISVTGVAAAATHLFGLAAPVPAPKRGDIPRYARPLPSTVVMAGINAGDPDGLPSWDVRVSRSETGELCTAVGQVQDGTFGILGLDQKFRALPLGEADACGLPPTGSNVQVGARPAVGVKGMTPRTLVVGIAGPRVKSVALVRDGRDTALPIGRDRAFLAVLEGLPDTVRPVVDVTDLAGRAQTISLSSSHEAEAQDPAGGTPWAISAGPAKKFVHLQARGAIAGAANTRCVQSKLEVDPATGGRMNSYYQQSSTPVACWPDAKTSSVVDIRRLVPSLGGVQPFIYGLTPSRTFVSGFAATDVRELTVTGPRVNQRVPIVAGNRSFVAVLDGRVDPSALRLRATLVSGQTTDVAAGGASLIGDNGRRYSLPSAPPWKDVVAVRASLGDGSFTKEVAGTRHLGAARVTDPAGGPAWGAETWLAHPNRPASPNDSSESLTCAAFGPVVDGAVRAPFGARASAVAPTGRQIVCSAANTKSKSASFTQLNPLVSAYPQVYVDDPTVASPKISRVAMTMVLPGVTKAVVQRHGSKADIPATVGDRGAVIALLPPHYAAPSTELRMRLTFADGRVVTGDWAAYSPPRRTPVARAVDPNGGAGWALVSFEHRDPRTPAMPGQLVDGRLTSIDPATGSIFFSSNGSSGAGTLNTKHHVWFAQQPTLDDSPSDAPSSASIARRTLAGVTVIFGGASPGVRTVTIHTPRDVRTVRPSPSTGLFLVVYDGRFTQGKITMTARGPGIVDVVQKPALW